MGGLEEGPGLSGLPTSSASSLQTMSYEWAVVSFAKFAGLVIDWRSHGSVSAVEPLEF